MMKNAILLALSVGAISTLAQTTPSSGSAITQPANNEANQSGTGAALFSSPSGQSFSVDQLAAQLQTLRSAVEQTLPVLAAFNQNYSNSLSGGSQSIGGAISGLLSGALNRNSQNTSAPVAHNSFSVTNVVAALENLVNTNRSGSAPVNPNTLRDLVALQNDLQPVLSLLQNLNVGSTPANQFARPYNVTPLTTNTLTPTGR